jgi:hypothetical protein
MSGPAIFADDLACDVRDTYRHLLEDRVPDDEAARRTIVDWQGLDADEEPVLWLALAATQSRHGRLTDEVRARALEVIDSGRDLVRWEALGPGPVAERRAVLASLRIELTGPSRPAGPSAGRGATSQTCSPATCWPGRPAPDSSSSCGSFKSGLIAQAPTPFLSAWLGTVATFRTPTSWRNCHGCPRLRRKLWEGL